jgi:hypothetical protein
MALNINGTTGISGVDGSASAPAVTGTDSNTGINFASDTVNINTGGSARVTVDSAGSVGIGTSTPTSSFSNADDLVVGDGSGHRGMTILAGTSSISGIEFSDGTGSDAAKTAGGIRYDHSGSYMRFNTNDGSERMRIDSSGNLLKNTTSTISTGSASDLGIQLGANNQAIFIASGGPAVLIARQNATGEAVRFGNQGASDVGSIDVTTSSTSYTTSSDYRLKENVVAISDGITRLKTLKPSRFNFKVDKDTTVDGFLAHEVTAVPEAITGTKDEVDSDNNPVYQGIDQSKLVPLLTAALQEAIAKIETLETKVAALEAG